MRTPSISSVQFSIGNPGEITSLEQLTRYVRDLEQRAATQFIKLAAGHLDMVYAEPLRPRMGDLALADGTQWNPGSGRGVYWYDQDAMTWNIMG